MEKITYFLGAGASYNALPIYLREDDEFYSSEFSWIYNSELHEKSTNHLGKNLLDSHNFLHRLILFRNKFKIENGIFLPSNGFIYKHTKSYIDTLNQSAQTFVNDLNWLIKQLLLHVSIDTVAKKLFVTNNNDLNKLKLLVSCFFVYEQRTKHYDQRYDTFIASFVEKPSNNLQNEVEFSNDIKVITWNYDIQFEVAFKNYTSASSIDSIQHKLNTFPFVEFKDHREFIENTFGIVRLNGVAGFYQDSNKNISQLTHESEGEEIENFLKEIVFSYIDGLKKPNYLTDVFCYSWENKEIATKAANYSKKILKDTEMLVIIGYSFPFFNRQIDDELMLSLSDPLKKIYIQDPNGDEIKEMLSERYYKYASKMEVIKNSRSFFIPTGQLQKRTPPRILSQ